MALLPLFCFTLLLSCLHVYSQCGIEPASGNTSLNSSNTIVNSYFPGAANVSAGSFSLTVGSRDTRGSSTSLSPGDLIVIIQMQGADLNTNNSNLYGDGVSSANAAGAVNNSNMIAGYYEYATVTSISAGTVNLMYGVARNYYNRSFSTSNGIRSFQIIRVPRYYNVTINNNKSVTAPAWNGSTGGVVVLDAVNQLTINGSINVTGLGFRGGGGKELGGASSGNTNGSTTLTNTDYRWNSPVTTSANKTGGAKGEGVAGTPAYIYVNGSSTTTTLTAEGYINGSMGRGAPGNAGGGGTDGSPTGSDENQYNSGGGGGANAGAGGMGGSGWHGGSGSLTTFPTGGYGGAAYVRNSLQQIVMGGGGGAGSANNSDVDNEVNCSGGAGGGIILTRAKIYAGSGAVRANGEDAPGVTQSYTPAQTDAAGGGGAGGSIVMVTRAAGSVGLGSVTASAKGGAGGDVSTYHDHGPGGGGGGGIIYTNGTFASTNVTGGSHGYTRTGSPSGDLDNAYGSTSGGSGSVVTLPGPPSLTNAIGEATLCGILPVKVKKEPVSESVAAAANTMVLYPNPASSHVTLQYEAKIRQQITIQVFNGGGKPLVNKTYSAVKGRNAIALPEIITFRPGLYLVQVNNGTTTLTEKLMITGRY